MSTFTDNVAGRSDSEGRNDWIISSGDGLYRDPRGTLQDGQTYAYKAQFADGLTAGYETGQGVWNSTTGTLTRATVKTSTDGDGVKYSFPAGS